MSRHGDWKEIKKAAIKAGLPDKFFKDDFGAALDDLDASEKALDKNKDGEKEEKLKEKAKKDAMKCTTILVNYISRCKEAEKGDDEAIAAGATVILSKGLGFINSINLLKKKYKY